MPACMFICVSSSLLSSPIVPPTPLPSPTPPLPPPGSFESFLVAYTSLVKKTFQFYELFDCSFVLECTDDNLECMDDNLECMDDNLECMDDNLECMDDNLECMDDNLECTDDNLECTDDNLECTDDNLEWMDNLIQLVVEAGDVRDDLVQSLLCNFLDTVTYSRHNTSTVITLTDDAVDIET